VCWVALFVAALIVSRRIPRILRTPQGAFPSADSETFAKWRFKSLLSTYLFLAFSIGCSAGLLVISQSIALQARSGRVPIAATLATFGLLILLIGGVIWALVLALQASAMHKRMFLPLLPPSPCPRPNQEFATEMPVGYENTTPPSASAE